MTPDDAVRKAAEAVADRAPGDWRDLEAAAGDDESRELLQLLRAIDAIGKANGSAADGALSHARWGKLELRGHVGAGTFGDVFRARDPALERDVALKLLRQRPHAPRGEGLEEGRLLARVKHPNVVTVHGADSIDGQVGLWMEFIEGPTLAEIVKAEGPLDEREAARIGVDVCRALAAIHAAGLLHRDVKADNVMRDAGGRIVLMDIGCGVPAAGSDEGTAGTPLYMAPEVLAGQPGTVASDIYAVGVLTYHLVTNSYPVTADSTEALRRAHQRGDRRPLREARPDLSRRFAQAVERALAADPARRYRSASEMEAALQRASSATASLRRHTLLASAGLAAAVVAVLLVAPALRDSSAISHGEAGLAGTSGRSSMPERRQLEDHHAFVATGPITPDGRLLPGIGFPTQAVSTMNVATGDVRPLIAPSVDGEGLEGNALFSPRLDRIAYVWRVGNGKELRVARADGGNVRTLLRRTSPGLAGWTPDGAAIIVQTAGDGGTMVDKIDATTGARTHLLGLPRRGSANAVLSPDGRYFLYDAPPRADEPTRDIYIRDLSTGATIAAVTGPANDVYPVWLHDGRGFLFASNRSGANGLWLQEVREGQPQGEPRLLQGNIGRVYPPVSVSTTGEFYYRQQTGLVDVFVAPVDLETNRVGPPAAVPTRQVGGHLFPDWSKDGRTLIFSWRRPESIDFDYKSASLVLHPASAGADAEVVPETDRVSLPRLSPDGRQAVIKSVKDGTWGFFLVDLASGATRLLVAGEDLWTAEWSGDGRSIYFQDGSAIREFDTATGLQRDLYRAAKGNGIDQCLVVSRSGRLAFIEYEGGERASLKVLFPGIAAAPKAVALGGVEGRVELAGWTPDEREVLAVRPTKGGPIELIRLLVTGGSPKTMGFTAQGMRDARVSPDGRWLAYTAGWPVITQWVIEHVVPAR